MSRGFERSVRSEMRFALDHHGDLSPAQYAYRRASGLRQPPRYRRQADASRAAAVAARRLQDGKGPDDCETCGNTGVQPRTRKVQRLIAELGLPVMTCEDCDRTPTEVGGTSHPTTKGQT